MAYAPAGALASAPDREVRARGPARADPGSGEDSLWDQERQMSNGDRTSADRYGDALRSQDPPQEGPVVRVHAHAVLTGELRAGHPIRGRAISRADAAPRDATLWPPDGRPRPHLTGAP